LLGQAAESLSLDLNGERLRAQNQLRKFMERADWLAEALEDLSEREKESLLVRVQSVTGMDALAKRAIMAGLVAADPAIKRILEGGSQEPEEEPGAARRYTSWRTFRERQAQLKRLIEEEIPANSREIARARSYGDLRENAEYKFAKEHQGILHRRRDEMERDLRIVHGTDFDGFTADVAGMGVAVRLRRGDGTVVRHCILGEWDRCEPLGILPSGSGVAVRLTGKRAGETVQLPSDAAEETWTVEAVEPLPPEARRWARGEDVAATASAPSVSSTPVAPSIS
jgi:transcription elongation GreA/GreB family factor